MPQDPWADFRPQPTPAPQPVRRPPTLQEKRAQEFDAATQAAIINANQEARAQKEEALRIAEENRKVKKFADDQTALEASGGVATTEGENTAVNLTSQLGNDLKKIAEINKAYPAAGQPSWLETAGEWIGGARGKAMATPGEVEDARLILSNRYRRATDVLLKMATGAASTEDERKNYVEMYAPQVTDSPAVLEDKKQMLYEAFQSGKLKAGAGSVRLESLAKEVDALYGTSGGLVQKSIDDIATPDQQQKSSEVRRLPAPEAMSQEHASWVRSNPEATAADYVRFREALAAKYKDPSGKMFSQENLQNVGKGVQDYLDYYRTHPNAEVPGLMVEEPLGMADHISAKVSDFLGEEATTGLLAAANAGSLGGVDLTVNPSQRRSWDMAKERNSKSEAAGDILGSMAPAYAVERGLATVGKAALGREAPIAASLLADTATSAERGWAGAKEGEGGEQALYGAAGGLLGSSGGRLLGKGIPGFRAPETNQRVDELLAGGTDLTTLQRAGAGKLEELGQGLPIVRGARENSLKSWNLAKVNEALGHVGEKLPKVVEAGVAANDAMNKILNARYSSLRPKINGSFDQQFSNSLAALSAAGRGSKVKRDLFSEVEEVLRPLKASGGYDGNTFKDADQRLRALSTDWMKATADTTTSPSTYHEMGRLVEQIRKQLRFQVERNTPEIAKDLKALDRAWSKAIRIEDASLRALKSEGVYAPSQMMETIKKLDTSPRKGMSARGKSFGQKETSDAAKVMGSKPVPETESWLQTGGLGYLAKEALGGTAVAATAGAAYTPGFKRITQALLTGKRPDLMKKVMKEIPPEIIGAILMRRTTTGD